MTQVTAEDITHAYRILLEREPDAGGLKHYMSLAASGLTLSDLRRHLLSSAEYRSKAADRSLIDIGEGVLVGIDPDEPEFGRTISHAHTWEPHLITLLKYHINTGDVFVDVGANVGMMTLTCAARVGSTGKVIAFEPHTDNIFQLMRGIIANGFKNISVYPFALSDAAKTYSIHGSSNGYLMPAGTSDHLATALIGDTILEPEPKISFIKFDIEGHEPFALRGLKKTLKRHRPKVLCEFNPHCLKTHIGIPPHEFATELFALSHEIIAVEYDGNENVLQNAQQLMSLWETRNATATKLGRLPDGMLHFDLYFQVD